jgi:hypothetical protein
MNYRWLSESLHPTADAAMAYFRREWGISGFRIEKPIHDDVEYLPSLSATTPDYHWLSIDVSETAYPKGGLDQFALDCKNRGLPVKHFVAMRADSRDPDYQYNVRRARASGIGLLEVKGSSGTIIYNALSLSLTGCRPIDKKLFPPKYRSSLINAETVFKDGDPAKGCSNVYDEIEALTRAIAKRTLKSGAWVKSVSGSGLPKMDLDKDPWKNVTMAMIRHCDFKTNGLPDITDELLSRVVGIIPYRNETGHKPKKVADLLKRDSQLRTRFETAVDILSDMVQAARPLRI